MKLLSKFPIGTRVTVTCGPNLGRNATVVSRSTITRHLSPSGVPQIGQGHYKPINWEQEKAIIYDDNNELDTAPICFLEKLGELIQPLSKT